jgi:hypothetical protein
VVLVANLKAQGVKHVFGGKSIVSTMRSDLSGGPTKADEAKL